jgi:hypothetical protein
LGSTMKSESLETDTSFVISKPPIISYPLEGLTYHPHTIHIPSTYHPHSSMEKNNYIILHKITIFPSGKLGFSTSMRTVPGRLQDPRRFRTDHPQDMSCRCHPRQLLHNFRWTLGEENPDGWWFFGTEPSVFGCSTDLNYLKLLGQFWCMVSLMACIVVNWSLPLNSKHPPKPWRIYGIYTYLGPWNGGV